MEKFRGIIRKTDMSLPGALLIVVSQLFSSFQSSDNISKEIEKFRNEFQQSIVDRETFFVRKTELSTIIGKIDQLNSKLIKMSEQIKNLKKEYYSLSDSADEYGPEIVGCSYDKRKDI